MVRRTRQELIGRGLFDVFPEMAGSIWDTTLRRVMTTGEAASVEEYYEPLDQWFEANAFPLADGISVFYRDISVRKRAERALESSSQHVRLLNAELEQRVARRTEQLAASNLELEAFSYSISHDLRAPLRGIDGFAQAIEEDYGDQLDADGRDYLARVRGAARHMAQLIDDLLRLSRTTRGEMRLEPVDLSALARHAVWQLTQADPARHVMVTIQPSLVVAGDRLLLQVVLENLLENAWKFTRNAPTPVIEFGSTAIGSATTFFVRDNGAGFDMAYVARLFGAFQRLHPTHEFEGNGSV